MPIKKLTYIVLREIDSYIIIYNAYKIIINFYLFMNYQCPYINYANFQHFDYLFKLIAIVHPQ